LLPARLPSLVVQSCLDHLAKLLVGLFLPTYLPPSCRYRFDLHCDKRAECLQRPASRHAIAFVLSHSFASFLTATVMAPVELYYVST